MKNSIYLLLILFVALFACNKGTVDLSKKDISLVGYQIEGIYDLSFPTNNTDADRGIVKLRLNVVSDSAFGGNLSLSVDGVPEKVTATFSPNEGIVPYTSELVFSLNGIPKPGKYPLKIKLSDANGKEKVYEMNLTIPIVDFTVTKQGGEITEDISIYNENNSQGIIYLMVKNYGISEKVVLSFSDLPLGVEAIFSENNQPYSFGTYVFFKAASAKPGIYPITLNAMTSSGQNATFKMNLIIEANCVASFSSVRYNFLRYENGNLVDSIYEYVSVAAINYPILPNVLIIDARKNSGITYTQTNLKLDCETNSVSVVTKLNSYVNNSQVTLEGKGTYNPITGEIFVDCLMNNTTKTQIRLVKK